MAGSVDQWDEVYEDISHLITMSSPKLHCAHLSVIVEFCFPLTTKYKEYKIDKYEIYLNVCNIFFSC